MREKRRYFRKVVEYEIEFSIVGEAERATGICRNLSLGGIHVETDTPAPFGANVTVYLSLRGMGPEGMPGIVRWVKPQRMGIQFGLLGARDTYAITQALAGE